MPDRVYPAYANLDVVTVVWNKNLLYTYGQLRILFPLQSYSVILDLLHIEKNYFVFY